MQKAATAGTLVQVGSFVSAGRLCGHQKEVTHIWERLQSHLLVGRQECRTVSFVLLFQIGCFMHTCSRPPLNRRLVIRIAYYSESLGPSGKFVENCTKLTLKLPVIGSSTVQCFGL